MSRQLVGTDVAKVEKVKMEHESNTAQEGSGARRFGWKVYAPIALVSLILVSVAFGLWFPPNDEEGPNDATSSQNDASSNDANSDSDRPQNDSVRPVAAYTPPSNDGYVGSEACADCHRELFESYRQHPMYGSTRRVEDEPAPPVADGGPALVVGKQRQFEIEMVDGSMIHHEKMYDANGDLIYDDAVPVHYVVGSGRRAKAYLIQRGELLFMSPLNWYGVNQKWDMAPSYVADDPRRFSRRANDICMNCHAGRLSPLAHRLDRFESEPYAEMAIGCERCHGPGESHVRFHELDRAGGDEPDPIVNPADLTHTERESVCFQCHLQPSSARFVRYGRSNLDFRPGDRFDDIWMIAETSSGVGSDGRTETVRHVQQMKESLCYQDSPEAMDCTTCHDPHGVPGVGNKDEFYRSRCYQCHNSDSCAAPNADRKQANDSCITCHMPRRDAREAAHVSQTDHRILRRPQALRRTTRTGEFSTIRVDDNPNIGPLEKKRVELLAEIANASLTGQPLPVRLADSLDELLERFPDDGELLIARGGIAWANRNPDLAVSMFERASKIPGSEESALTRLMESSYMLSDFESAYDYANRLLVVNPYLARAYALRGDAAMTLGRSEQGLADSHRAVELDPSLIAVREWLVQAYRHLGRADELREQRELVERMRTARPLLPSDDTPGDE